MKLKDIETMLRYGYAVKRKSWPDGKFLEADTLGFGGLRSIHDWIFLCSRFKCF